MKKLSYNILCKLQSGKYMDLIVREISLLIIIYLLDNEYSNF